MSERYVVTVEYEVFADNRSNAVRQFFLDKDRFLTVRDVRQQDDPNANPSIYQHEHAYYNEDGEPNFVLDSGATA